MLQNKMAGVSRPPYVKVGIRQERSGIPDSGPPALAK